MPLYPQSAATFREVFPGYLGRFIHGSNATLAYWQVQAGSPIPEHQHPHEQIVNCLLGEFSVTIDGQTHHLTAGDTLIIPANARHQAMAITDAEILDVFTPVRADYQR